MSEFEDGLRSALSEAANSYSPSPTMGRRIEAAVTRRDGRRRRVVAGGAGALALSLSLGVAGATLMSDTGGGGQAKIASPKTTPPERSSRSTDPNASPTVPPSAPLPAPAPSATACPPKSTGAGNINSHRASWSPSNASTDHALAQLATPAASLMSTGSTGGSTTSSGSGNSSSVTTGNATSGNTSNNTTTQNNTGGSTTNNNHTPPPVEPPVPPVVTPPEEPPIQGPVVSPETQSPYPAGTSVQGSSVRPQPGSPAGC